jgi:multiple sugar transport system permease protein
MFYLLAVIIAIIVGLLIVSRSGLNFKVKRKIYHVVALAAIAVALIVYLVPIYWILATSLKGWTDIFKIPPKFIPFNSEHELSFSPTLENYKKLFAEGSLYPKRIVNSIIIGSISTILAVGLGTVSAYAFSRFKIKGKNDMLFFILSTRMLPPVVVVIPLFLMYRALHLIDTHLGLILLYTTFNVSFAVWLMKGFIDEIPKEYEDAALVDGYTRFKAFVKVVLPQSVTGIAATSVFCLITAWNEFAFALIMTSDRASTAPPSIPNVLGTKGVDWGQIAAGTFLFLLPVAIFTFLMRKHLLRGVTFGAIKK